MAMSEHADPSCALRAHIGSLLHHWRRAAGLSQHQLGRRLGYHHSFISKIESGARWPPPLLLSHADQVLGADGELSALWRVVVSARSGSPDDTPLEAPVPCGAEPDPPRERLGFPELAGLRGLRLPLFGVTCPAHGADGCQAALEEDALIPHLRAGAPSGHHRAGAEVVHGFAVLLAAFTKANVETKAAGTIASTERCLRALTRLAGHTGGKTATGLRYLAPQYAHLAGWLRVELGQRGLGMLWFDRGVDWGRAAGNVPAVCECLGRMSLVARLERDGPCAAGYAEALRAAGAGRLWAEVLAEIHLLRARAVTGDLAGLTAHVSAARNLLDRADDDPSWLSGRKGHAFVESSVSAGFRDIAALSGDARAAGSALTAAKLALANVSPRMRPSEVLLTLRLADAYACSGVPDSAVEIAAAAAPEAVALDTTLINAELHGLRGRLWRTWGELAEVREFDDLLRAERARVDTT
ncbi:helix-turn-helix domain-containing protein [Amycolatopsis sp. cmx-11-12]|uniref:helix-turn-helix domain-containing protein n=1 Tax=Amycolatopsis sp. cmx-11-12 TaxID=2785795 RepID=UPI0039172BC6